MEGGYNRQGESEASISDALSVLGADLKFMNGRLAKWGWAPVNISHPSNCAMPLLCATWNTLGQMCLSAGSGEEDIRH